MRELKSDPISDFLTRVVGRFGAAVLAFLAFGFVVIGDYTPGVLAAVLGLVFLGAIILRVLIFWDNEGFSPNRIQIGASWILLGYDPSTSEFDTGPVRTYFVILCLLFFGVVLRPFLRSILLGLSPEAVVF